MSVLTPSGILLTDDNGKTFVVGTSSDAWSDKSSWSTYRTWTESANDIEWLTPGIDMGSVQDFVLYTEITCVGTPTYYVYTSDTGAFAGEETTTTITTSSTTIGYFNGRYLMIGIVITANESEGIPVLEYFNYTCSTKGNTVYLNDVYSGDLSGSLTGRILSVPRGASKIVNVGLTAHKADEWVESDYFTPLDDFGYPILWTEGASSGSYLSTDLYIESPRIPVGGIVSKSTAGPQIAFTLNEEFTESTFDAQLYVLPEMYINGKNISIR